VVGKPLYRVHSGQLGTTAASVGATLSGILQRAARWDAILSRCIAKIQYETPPKPDVIRLSKLLAEQSGADLTDDLIEALTSAYPKASGRDVTELLKLTTRYCRAKQIPLSEDAFRVCALFRGHA
jgi:hypothetical protein